MSKLVYTEPVPGARRAPTHARKTDEIFVITPSKNCFAFPEKKSHTAAETVGKLLEKRTALRGTPRRGPCPGRAR